MSGSNVIVVSQARPSVSVTEDRSLTIEGNTIVSVDAAMPVLTVDFYTVQGASGADGVSPDVQNPSVIAAIKVGLEAQIGASHLDSTLKTSIEKIDLGPTSLEAQVAILASADTLLNAAIGENGERILAADNLISAAQSDIEAIQTELTSIDGSISGFVTSLSSVDTRVSTVENSIVTQGQTIDSLSTAVDIAESNITAQASIVSANTIAITALQEGGTEVIAETLQTLLVGVDGEEVAIELRDYVIAGTVTPLFAQHTVKLDVNGKISGFGLTSTEDSSLFEILADRFAITNGLNSGIIPFIVDGANVYIQNGFIQNAAIDTAQIADAAITVAKIEDATITAAKIADAAITNLKVGSYVASTSFNGDTSDPWTTPGSIGWCISKTAGDAVFNRVKVRGDIEATSLKADTAMIATAHIADAQITSAKIANATITGADIASATIGTGNIANAQITAALIADANITNAKIGAAAVNTLKIGSNAVTLPIGTSATSAAYGNGIQLLASTFTCVGQPVYMQATVVVRTDSGTAGTYRLLLRVDGAAIFDTGIVSAMTTAAFGSVLVSLSYIVTVSAASHTFDLLGYSDPDGGGNCSFMARALVCTELRR